MNDDKCKFLLQQEKRQKSGTNLTQFKVYLLEIHKRELFINYLTL